MCIGRQLDRLTMITAELFYRALRNERIKHRHEIELLERQLSEVRESNTNIHMIVNEMKMEDIKKKGPIIEQINSEKSLTCKCILARKYLSPQSTDMETICRRDLQINKPLDDHSGDGHKNGTNFEIKISIHSKAARVNFVQIRPSHNIDFYIFITYNMYENETIGKAHIFKVPAAKVYDLVINYGGYAHGTNKTNGNINALTLKSGQLEYALRCNPNSKKGKSRELWNELCKYETEYNPSFF